MSAVISFIVSLCAACVFIGALHIICPDGVMQKPVKYILSLVFLVVVITSAGISLAGADLNIDFGASPEVSAQSLDAAAARYVYAAALTNYGINFSEITVCTDKSDDGSIIITKVIVYSDCEEWAVREALGVVAENYEVEVAHE